MRNRYVPHRAMLRVRGFSLLELIVAFTLMALIITALLRVFSGGMQGISAAEDYARATSVAESALARVGADIQLKEGASRGSVDDRYGWLVDIRPYQPQATTAGSGGEAGASAQVNTLPVVLHEVIVSVSWNEGGRDRQVQLKSLRIGPRA